MDERELSPPEYLDDLYPPSKYLKVNILRGRDVTLKIERVGRREIEDEQTGEPKVEGFVVFERTQKMRAANVPNMLTINKTNGLALAAMFGAKTADWVGKRVTLMPARDMGLGGKLVDCIRFRGSPDIREPISYTRKRRKRKPETFTAIPTGDAKSAQTEDKK
jgi:hypothetical protein